MRKFACVCVYECMLVIPDAATMAMFICKIHITKMVH